MIVSLRIRVLLSLSILGTVVLSSALHSQNPGGRRGGGGFGSMTALQLARIADTDKDSAVSAAELEAFLGSFAETAKEGIDRNLLLARTLAPELDRDKDGRLQVADLASMFAARDANGDGQLRRFEVRGARGAGGGAGMMDAIVLHSADADKNGAISKGEWQQFCSALERTDKPVIRTATVAAWIQNTATMRSDNRNAMTPDVMLATRSAALDANRDGVVRRADLEQILGALDRNKDGVLQKEELATRRTAGPRRPADRRGSRAVRSDRSKPPLMPWQRNLDDALALVEKTGKPLLICVNMDGEPASERLAWGHYRDPEFVRLAAGFIPVLASPDRRTAFDHDSRGRRIPEERFGRLVNSEHIDIELVLFDRYFRGQRVAPRHVGVDKDGKILFDIYLVGNLAVVDEALEKHGRPDVQPPVKTASLSERALLASPDAAHRAELEKRFLAGDVPTRRRLARIAMSATRKTQHPEVLRLALFDDDRSVRASATLTAAASIEQIGLPLVRRALFCAAGDASLTADLVDALDRWAHETIDEQQKRDARHLCRVFAGLNLESKLPDLAVWQRRLAGAPVPAPIDLSPQQLGSLDEELNRLDKHLQQTPDDPGLRLAQSKLTLHYARIRAAEGKDPTFLLQDARNAGARATAPDKPDAVALAVMSVASHLLGEPDRAAAEGARALRAMQRVGGLSASAISAEVLDIFAQSRMRALYAAMRSKREWPAGWISDIRAAYEVLLAHPAGTEKQALAYLSWLGVLGATGQEEAALQRVLARFPLSTSVHAHLRTLYLANHGLAAVLDTYARLRRTVPDHAATVDWYTGLACLVIAERLVQTRQDDAARRGYETSIKRFADSVQAKSEFADSAAHYSCLAHAGRARVQVGRGNWDAAVRSISRAIAARPGSMRSKDGLGKTPLATAGEVIRALRSAGRKEDADKLVEQLGKAGFNGE